MLKAPRCGTPVLGKAMALRPASRTHSPTSWIVLWNELLGELHTTVSTALRISRSSRIKAAMYATATMVLPPPVSSV